MLLRFRFVLVLAALILMVLPISMLAQVMENDRDAMIAVWERFDKELWQGWNLDLGEELLTEDFVMHSWNYPDFSREDYVYNWIPTSSGAIPAYTMDHHFIMIDGDYVIVDDNWGGVNDGAFPDLEPTHKDIRVNGVEIFRFEENRIAELWVLYDNMRFLLQLGVVPSENEVLPDTPWDIAMGETSTSPQENKEMVAGLVDKLNDHDVPGYFAGFSDDAVIHDVDIDLTVEEAVDMMIDIQTNFPDHQAVDVTYFAEGDLVVYMFTLTFVGDQVLVGGVNVDRIEDGKIVEEWWLYDSLGMSEQMAAMQEAGG